jgi:hypothetical protein
MSPVAAPESRGSTHARVITRIRGSSIHAPILPFRIDTITVVWDGFHGGEFRWRLRFFHFNLARTNTPAGRFTSERRAFSSIRIAAVCQSNYFIISQPMGQSLPELCSMFITDHKHNSITLISLAARSIKIIGLRGRFPRETARFPSDKSLVFNIEEAARYVLKYICKTDPLEILREKRALVKRF